MKHFLCVSSPPFILAVQLHMNFQRLLLGFLVTKPGLILELFLEKSTFPLKTPAHLYSHCLC